MPTTYVYKVFITKQRNGKCVEKYGTAAGVNIYAICYVVPVGIAMYAVSGGLKSTFITSWIHTVIIFVAITIFYFKTFFGGGLLGSIELVNPQP